MRLLGLWISCCLVGIGVGQEKAETPPRFMRLLAVGESPPFRQEVRDGVRIQLPAPPGSLPPGQLALSLMAESGREKDVAELRLRIGKVTPPIEVPSGPGTLVLRVGDEAANAEPWYVFVCPPERDFLLVMWRGQGESWDTPTAFIVPTTLPEGQVSLINVAPTPVAVVYQAERIALPPKRPLMRPLKPGKPVSFQVGLPKRNSLQRLVSRSLEHGAGQHSLVVFFRNDGERPRSPLGIEVLRVKGE